MSELPICLDCGFRHGTFDVCKPDDLHTAEARAPHEPPADTDGISYIELLERKLTRRRFLNQSDIRRKRFTFHGSRSIALRFADAEAILTILRHAEARPAPPLDWQPIPKLTQESRERKPFTLPVWGFAPSLIDEDFNPSGIVEMYYQDDQGWIGAIWNGEQDCWDAKPIRPTYWLEMNTPAVPTPMLPDPPAAVPQAAQE